jgi:hypothetical protein
MARTIGLTGVADSLGPRFAERIQELDAADAFVAENYEDLKKAKVFSA